MRTRVRVRILVGLVVLGRRGTLGIELGGRGPRRRLLAGRARRGLVADRSVGLRALVDLGLRGERHAGQDTEECGGAEAPGRRCFEHGDSVWDGRRGAMFSHRLGGQGSRRAEVRRRVNDALGAVVLRASCFEAIDETFVRAGASVRNTACGLRPARTNDGAG